MQVGKFRNEKIKFHNIILPYVVNVLIKLYFYFLYILNKHWLLVFCDYLLINCIIKKTCFIF